MRRMGHDKMEEKTRKGTNDETKLKEIATKRVKGNQNGRGKKDIMQLKRKKQKHNGNHHGLISTMNCSFIASNTQLVHLTS